jgi:Transposase
MKQIVIGVDPHKLSATIEVVDQHERVLGSGRFGTDKAGYAAMLGYVAQWSRPTWAVEGSNGAGRSLAQRLVADGEHVVDVPAKLAARVRLLDTGHGRKTDLLTELPGLDSPGGVRLPIGVATFPVRDQRRGWVAGVVRFGGAAGRVA